MVHMVASNVLSAKLSCVTQPSGSEVTRTDLVLSQTQFSPVPGNLFVYAGHAGT